MLTPIGARQESKMIEILPGPLPLQRGQKALGLKKEGQRSRFPVAVQLQERLPDEHPE